MHISKEIEELAGSSIKIVDSREGVAKQALRVFENGPSKSSNLKIQDKTFFVTSEKTSKEEYEILSKKLNLNYGGVLQNN